MTSETWCFGRGRPLECIIHKQPELHTSSSLEVLHTASLLVEAKLGRLAGRPPPWEKDWGASRVRQTEIKHWDLNPLSKKLRKCFQVSPLFSAASNSPSLPSPICNHPLNVCVHRLYANSFQAHLDQLSHQLLPTRYRH